MGPGFIIFSPFFKALIYPINVIMIFLDSVIRVVKSSHKEMDFGVGTILALVIFIGILFAIGFGLDHLARSNNFPVYLRFFKFYLPVLYFILLAGAFVFNL